MSHALKYIQSKKKTKARQAQQQEEQPQGPELKVEEIVARIEERGAVGIYSEALAETVYFISDTYQNPEALPGITYTLAELAQVIDLTAAELKHIHEAKKQLGGQLVDHNKLRWWEHGK